MRKSLIFDCLHEKELRIIEHYDGSSLAFDFDGQVVVMTGDEVHKLMTALGGGYRQKQLNYMTKEDIEAKKRVEENLKREAEEKEADASHEPTPTTEDD